MLSYSFSTREKALMLFLAIVVVVVAWFALVFQRTTNELVELDGRIADVQSEQNLVAGKVKKLQSMEKAIEDRKAAGAVYTEIPKYDNITRLMGELDRIMARADSYTVSFDKIDRDSASGYVLRGVDLSFDCGSFESAESILWSLVTGSYPCSIDSIDMSTRTSRSSSGFNVSAHVIFVEKVSK